MTNFFGPGSPYLGHPLLTEERTATEVRKILSWCPTVPTDVLDLGCGFGRHSIEFARRGLLVTGVDPSAALLDEARRRAENEKLSIDFLEGEGESFEREASFDLAVCLFTTLGQLSAVGADPQIDSVLANLRASLRPGGVLIVEVPERDRAVAKLVQSEQLGPTHVTRTFDPATNVLSEEFDTPAGVYDLAYVLMSEDELVAALETAGFGVDAIYHEAVIPPPDTFMTVVASV